MGEALIVRKGGTAATKAPSINFVSSTFDSITFTITNNDTATADIFWEVGDSTPDANTLSLAGGATSSNQVASGLDEETSYTIFAFANVEGKAGSQTTSIAQTTPEIPILYNIATGGTTLEYDSGGKRYRSHTFTSNGTFEVTQVGDATDNRNRIDYVLVAGGGGRGEHFQNRGSGAGGAGGYRVFQTTATLASSSVVIGAGGGIGSDGGNSSVLGNTNTGGGKGARSSSGASGGNGGSGGGGRWLNEAGGTGITGQGFAGGRGYSGNQSLKRNGGGGGGATGVGGNGQSNNGGNGGPGATNNFRTGVNEAMAGGGASSGYGSNVSGTEGVGFDNFGGGSGTGSGQGGVVIIRYEIAPSV